MGVLKLDIFLSNDGFNNSNKHQTSALSSDNNERILQESVADQDTVYKTPLFPHANGLKDEPIFLLAQIDIVSYAEVTKQVKFTVFSK